MQSHHKRVLLAVPLFLVAACGGGKSSPKATTPQASMVEIKGFQTPESVLYWADQDVYLVSNINGDPFGADDNGFISQLGPDGKVKNLKWIDGGADAVQLSAPKGMAIRGGKLYVADIDHVRVFALDTGAPAGDIAVEGAGFLNDVAAEGDLLVVSDSGLGKDFKSSSTETIYRITPEDGVEKLIAGPDLAGPNGVAIAGGQVWVATFGAKEIYRVADGKKTDVMATPFGQLDGLVISGDDIVVSSWEAKGVLTGKRGGKLTQVVSGVPSPADIAVDRGRHRVVIPVFTGNAVRFYPLPD